MATVGNARVGDADKRPADQKRVPARHHGCEHGQRAPDATSDAAIAACVPTYFGKAAADSHQNREQARGRDLARYVNMSASGISPLDRLNTLAGVQPWV